MCEVKMFVARMARSNAPHVFDVKIFASYMTAPSGRFIIGIQRNALQPECAVYQLCVCHCNVLSIDLS